MRPEQDPAPAPRITVEEIEAALKKGAESARELDKKLDQVFRPLDPREDYYLRGSR